MENCFDSFCSQLVLVFNLSAISYYIVSDPFAAGFARDVRMKHPIRSDFHTVVTEAGVTVTFKPTKSIYSFYRLADSDDIARLARVSFAGVQHAGRDTGDYPADEVKAMAQRIASDWCVPLVSSRRESDR
jgi:hypothetical protein